MIELTPSATHAYASAPSSLPPPTPPSGKRRGDMQALVKTSFPYQVQMSQPLYCCTLIMLLSSLQRFKPLPAIGSTRQVQSSSGGNYSDFVVSADSAVDLNSPSPPASSPEKRSLSKSAETAELRSDRKHLHLSDSLVSSRENCRSSEKVYVTPICIETTTSTLGTADDDLGVRRSLRLLVRSKLAIEPNVVPHENAAHVHEPNLEVPPEPSKDAPHTVTLKLRLPEGECIQRRFNYEVDQLGCVLCFARSAMRSQDIDWDLSLRNVTLSRSCVPKVKFSDLSLTLEQVGLVHNTLLHVDYEDR